MLFKWQASRVGVVLWLPRLAWYRFLPLGGITWPTRSLSLEPSVAALAGALNPESFHHATWDLEER